MLLVAFVAYLQRCNESLKLNLPCHILGPPRTSGDREQPCLASLRMRRRGTGSIDLDLGLYVARVGGGAYNIIYYDII